MITFLAVSPWGMHWAVTDPIGRLLTLGAVLIAGATLFTGWRHGAKSGRRASSMWFGVCIVGALTVAAATLVGPLRLPDWYVTMNPGGLETSGKDQHAASLIFFFAAVLAASAGALLVARTDRRPDDLRKNPDSLR
ncbi:hypothetical protein [Frondihabitans sp. VKM Ac-2883]|uniref:hypothetical protein n=1 Tax=Frondihabitans sp. VKM Ac-2883 TaxID=2783823 RepID=UPI00188D88F1|nr:hypothetical protein [Frondihabitans sp. VKM Ac-2883]MBF4575470.1 hypothetical protein [Frondihabitans sp. VKM Ac-2883]